MNVVHLPMEMRSMSSGPCAYCGQTIRTDTGEIVAWHEERCKIKLFQDEQRALLTEIRDLLKGMQR